MNNFNKPKLIDKNFLKKIIMKNTQKTANYIQYWDMIKQNILIITFIGLLAYFLYYRYNQAKIKALKEKQIQQQKILEQQQLQQQMLNQQYISSRKKIVDPRTREQTRFIPEDKQYSVPRNSQTPYLKQHINDVNNYVELNTIQPNQLPDHNLTNNIDPINLNFNYLEQIPSTKQKPNEFDYSLKTRSASFLTPQYIGPNFSPL